MFCLVLSSKRVGFAQHFQGLSSKRICFAQYLQGLSKVWVVKVFVLLSVCEGMSRNSICVAYVFEGLSSKNVGII